MKILFYVEVHPIRNELIHHSSVLLGKWGKKIVGWAKDGQLEDNQIKVACHHFHYQLANDKIPDLVPYLLPTTLEEEKKIQANLIHWNQDGKNLWCSLMKGENDARLDVYRDFLTRIKKSFDFDVVIFWGLNDFAANVVKELMAVPLFMELASIRNPFPSSVYLDAKGVNGFATTASLNLDFIREKAKNLRISSDLLENKHNSPLSQSQLFDGKFDFQEVNFYSSTETNPSKKVLVPLQIFDDSNILLGSPYNDVVEFVEDVISSFSESDYELVFKPHPGAYHRGGIVFEGHYKAMMLVNQADNATWLEEEISKDEYLSFLRQFDAIVTINSSVGFEGMILGVPVFPLGEAIYKPLGYKVDKKNLPAQLCNNREEMIENGYLISRFILNLNFLNELQVRSSLSYFLKRMNLHCKYSDGKYSIEQLYEGLIDLRNEEVTW